MNAAPKTAIVKIKEHPVGSAFIIAIAVAVSVALFWFWIVRFSAARHEVEIVYDAKAAPRVQIGTLGYDPHIIYSEDIVYPNVVRDWEVEIEATGKNAPNAWGMETWIQKITTENGDFDWSRVTFEEGWIEKTSPIGANGKAFVCYGKDGPRKMRFSVRAQKLDITYSCLQWAGLIRLTINGVSREIDAWRASFAPETLHCVAPPKEGDAVSGCRIDKFWSEDEIGPAMRLKLTSPSGAIAIGSVSYDGVPVRFNDYGTIWLPTFFATVAWPALLMAIATLPAAAFLLWILWIIICRWPFVTFAALAVIVKLWIVGGDEIRANPYDAHGYMLSSLHNFWNLGFSTHAYDRQPGFPLTIWAGRELGLPLRLWLELIYCAACITLATALPRLKLPKWSAYVALALTVFNPLTFPVMAFGYQDAAYAPFFMFLVAAMLHALPSGKERYYASALAGVAAALVWNTRPEHILVAFMLALFAAMIAFAEWQVSRKLFSSIFEAVKCAAPSIALIAGVTLAIAAMGRSTQMGSFSASSFELKGFTALYDELLAIVPEKPEAYHPIPTDVRMKGYAASPSFAMMKDALEGPALDVYRPMSARDGRVTADFGVYAFWGLRLAPWYMKKWDSAAQLDRYYAKCAEELRAAREKGVYKSRKVYASFVDPDMNLWMPYLKDGVAAYWKVLARTEVEGLYPESDDVEGELFDKAALRRGALVKDNEAIFSNPSRESIKCAKKICAQTSAVVTWLAAIAVLPFAVLIFILVIKRREPETTLAASAFIILTGAFFSRFAVMTVMHAVAFTAETRYIMPVAPLPAVFAVLAAAFVCVIVADRPGKHDV
jgi:hypothetical protein